MKRLGNLLHVFTAVCVVRCEHGFKPNLNDVAVDSSLNRVGKVVDIFGPVEKPYALVEVKDKTDLDLEPGSRIYVRE